MFDTVSLGEGYLKRIGGKVQLKIRLYLPLDKCASGGPLGMQGLGTKYVMSYH